MGAEDRGAAGTLHEVSVVVPVYQGERTLEALCAEIAPLAEPQATVAQLCARLGIDRS